MNRLPQGAARGPRDNSAILFKSPWLRPTDVPSKQYSQTEEGNRCGTGWVRI